MTKTPLKLELRFLGVPEVRLHGQPVVFRTRRALALLAYLTLESGPQSRETLADLIAPESSGRSGFRTVLFHLREALGDAASAIVASRKALEFKPDGLDCTCDLWTHETGASGELLAGLTLEDSPAWGDWLEHQRQRWRERLDRNLESVFAVQLEAGQGRKALETSRAWVRLDPLNETAHQAMLQAHLHLHDRTGGLETHARLQALLERELGLKPAEKTEALVTEIRRLGSKPVAQPLASTGLERLPFVGRNQAWEQLQQAWDGGQLLCISGEPGIGKTRLVQDFLAARGRFAWIKGQPDDANVPFASITRFLRGLITAAHEWSRWTRQELSRLLPELLEPDQLPQQSADKLRLFEAMAEVIRQTSKDLTGKDLTGKDLIGIVLDDVQFFDPASLEAFTYLKHRLADHGWHSLMIYRKGELEPGFEANLQAQIAAGQALLIELEALSESDLGVLLEQLALNQTAAFVHALWQATAGNPLFVLETLRLLQESGQLQTHSNSLSQSSLPRSTKVTALIAARLNRLSKAARDVARLIAVAGEQFSLDLAGALLSKNTLDLTDANDELERAGLVRGERFSHDLLAEGTRAEMTASTRRLLHARTLEYLEQIGVAPGVLARHALEAGQVRKAFSLAIAAGDAARTSLTLQASLEHYAWARNLLKPFGGSLEVRDAPRADVERLYYIHAVTHYQLGDFAREHETLEEGLNVAREAGLIELEVMSLWRLSEHLRHSTAQPDHPRAEILLLEASRIAERHGDWIGQVHAQTRLMMLEFERLNFSRALELGAGNLVRVNACTDLERFGVSNAIHEAKTGLATICNTIGDWSQAQRLLDEVIITVEPRYRITLDRARVARAIAQIHLGDVEGAIQVLREIVETHHAIGYRELYAEAAAALVLGLLETGQTVQALEVSQLASELTGQTHAIAWTPVQIGLAHALALMRNQRNTEAIPILDRTRQLCQTLELRIPRFAWPAAVADSLQSAALALEGHWEDAAPHAKRAVEFRLEHDMQQGLWVKHLPVQLEQEILTRARQVESVSKHSINPDLPATTNHNHVDFASR
jgi:DNA-binding SARP family transcriptional activator